MKRPVCPLSILLLLAGMLPAAVHAQFKWVDESGQVVYSDRPPATPRAGVQVLRGSVADQSGAAKAGAENSTKEANAPRTFAERDMAFKRRQQEREQAERKQAEQVQKAAQLAKICEDRRTDLRTLDSGARISRVEANGERAFMNDEEAAKRRDDLQKALTEDCRRG